MSIEEKVDLVIQRLARIESDIETLIGQRAIKDLYTTDEVAEILDKSEYTVREWCRLGRVCAQKRRCGRGLSKEWVIPHGELLRLQNEGLLPDPARSA